MAVQLGHGGKGIIMARIFIIKDETTKTQFALAIAQDDGTITETKPIDKMKQESNKEWTLILPENPLNRKFISLKRAQSSDIVELGEPAVKNTSNVTAPKTPLENFLEGEERELFIKLRDKAIAKASIQVELERKRLAFERAKAEYEALLNGSN